MTSQDRRQFIKLAAAAGATFAAGSLPPAIRKALAIPANRKTGTIKDVEHVVILMQENRSFDHYFGSLRGVRGFGDPRPVSLSSGKSVFYQPTGDASGDYLLPFHPKPSANNATGNLGVEFIQDLAHGWNDTHNAINGGRNDGWVPAKGTTTMAYLTREDIPFHYALADAFTICDGYHCSIPSSTDPNRYYMWTGYVGNDGTGGGPVLDNSELGYGWTTYPERLEKAGISWKIYQDIGTGLDADGAWGWTGDPYIGNYGDNSLLYFDQYRNAQPGNPLYDKARTGTNLHAESTYNPEDFFAQLKQDVQNGTLPQVSWVVAPEAFTEHPSWPAAFGAWYVAQVLEALTSNPDVWSKTALFITYDENDGFFDHAVPPFAPSSRDQGLSTVSTDEEWYDLGKGFQNGAYGLGARVPMLVVSPWSTGGYVCSQTFDHTSIIRFLEERFGVKEPNISAWRRMVCGDLTSAFDFSKNQTRLPALPSVSAFEPSYGESEPSYHPVPPTQQSLPAQEAGQRPARPLPYDLSVNGRAERDSGRFWLDFDNDGAAGVSFLVTSGNRTDGPWTYTVGSYNSLSDYWTSSVSGGVYDLSVYGPNGYLRGFRGTQPAAKGNKPVPEATLHLGGKNGGHVNGRITINLINLGKKPCVFTVTPKAYLDGLARTYVVMPGGNVPDVWDVKSSDHWYDLEVTVDSDAQFVRRFAGHVETGKASVSDPALGQR